MLENVVRKAASIDLRSVLRTHRMPHYVGSGDMLECTRKCQRKCPHEGLCLLCQMSWKLLMANAIVLTKMTRKCAWSFFTCNIQKNSRRLWQSQSRKSRSFPEGRADFELAAVFLAGKVPQTLAGIGFCAAGQSGKNFIRSQKRLTKPKHRKNSTKEFSEQFEGVTGSLPSRTSWVLKQIARESSPERSAKSLSHSFFVGPFLSPKNVQQRRNLPQTLLARNFGHSPLEFSDTSLSVAIFFARYRGHLGPSGPKSKKVRKWVPRARGSKKSKKSAKLTNFLTSWTLFWLFFDFFFDPGAERPWEPTFGFFFRLWARRAQMTPRKLSVNSSALICQRIPA